MATGLRWSLIVEKIQQEHPEAEVKSEDVEAEVDKAIQEILGQQGNTDPDLEKRYKEHILSNEEMVRNYYSRVLSDRVFGLLEGKISTKKESIAASEFIEM